jgi:hypothetical protein
MFRSFDIGTAKLHARSSVEQGKGAPEGARSQRYSFTAPVIAET